MKIRQGFVSNSSSSSFICDACNEEVTGWDVYPTFVCENEHHLCECCSPDYTDISLEDKRKIIVYAYLKRINEYNSCVGVCKPDDTDSIGYYKSCVRETTSAYNTFLVNISDDNFVSDLYDEIYAELENMPHEYCPICTFQVFCESELSFYLYKKFGISRDGVFAVIKSKNKKRKKLYNSEYIEHVLNKFNITIGVIKDEIRSKFDSWDEFNKYLSGETNED